MSEDRTRKNLPDDLYLAFLKKDRLACARLITIIDNHPEQIPNVLDFLIPHQSGAVRVGITGPPGVGKSTVTAALAKTASSCGKKIGVIAVDPSSPFTGGAFLGDRVRMQNLIGNDRVFIRSLASRDGHGGISPVTPYAADIFDAFGMDLILIETVGVGQAELDVLNCADFIIMVMQPSTGDVIQALKAGIIEAGDLFLINKADLPGTENLVDALNFIFQTNTAGKLVPPILTASAVKNQGIDELYTVLMAQIEKFKKAGILMKKRQFRYKEEIQRNLQQKLWTQFLTLTQAAGMIDDAGLRCAESGDSPFPFINKLWSRIEIHVKQHDNDIAN